MASRLLLLVGVLVAEGTASADRSLEIELAAGAAIPVATDEWKGRVDTGWKLAGRGTREVRGQLAVMGIEFARFPARSCDRFDRLRVMGGLAHQWLFDPVSVSARIAIGIDALSTTCTSLAPPQLGLPAAQRRFYPGLGGEAAATLWLIQGVVDIGIEVGIPLAFHRHDGDSESGNLRYVGVDLDILLAFRVR